MLTSLVARHVESLKATPNTASVTIGEGNGMEYEDEEDSLRDSRFESSP